MPPGKHSPATTWHGYRDIAQPGGFLDALYVKKCAVCPPHSTCIQGQVIQHAEYKISKRQVLDASSACWVLTLELNVPVEMALLRSDVDIEIINGAQGLCFGISSCLAFCNSDCTTDDAESQSSVVISRTPPEPDSKIKLLAVYRNESPSSR